MRDVWKAVTGATAAKASLSASPTSATLKAWRAGTKTLYKTETTQRTQNRIFHKERTGFLNSG